jgi:hypothetical protein
MSEPTTRRALLASVVALGAAGLATSAYAAESGWAASHPRRAEVNRRLANQSRRINQEYKSGQIGKGQAQHLHHEDQQVRQEERDMASQDGGHITRQEQRTLNQQESGISRQIGQ